MSQTPGVADHARADQIDVDRPNPLAKAANSAGVAWAGLSGVVGGASSFGLLTAAQAASINQIGEALPGWILAVGTILGVIVPAVGTLVGSFRTVAAGKPDTTPIRDPRDVDGVKLVRVDGAPLGGR